MEFKELAFYAAEELIPVCVRLSYIVIAVLVAKVMIPWLQEKRLYSLVLEFVQAAEKLAESKQIDKAEKYTFVIKSLEEHNVKITPVIRLLIESAVEELDVLKANIKKIQNG